MSVELALKHGLEEEARLEALGRRGAGEEDLDEGPLVFEQL